MKIKRSYLIIIGIVFLFLIGWAFIRFVIGGNEDDWIKNEKGIWVKHGNPGTTPDYVLEQQTAINCAYEKFDNFTQEKNSQCLGICGNYAIDVVHVPRTAEDNLAENQCSDYANGQVGNFIELDKQENIVRIVE